jgi:hypothetical protein
MQWKIPAKNSFIPIYEGRIPTLTVHIPIAKFLGPDWGGYIDDSGKGLSYRHARLHIDYARVGCIPQPGIKNLASVRSLF